MTTATAPEIQCHYDVLGVERDADPTTIKKAHRKLILKHHPDKNQGIHTDQFLLIQQAYECLSDPVERKWYDEHRTAILAGWKSGDGGVDDIVFDVNPYLYAGCYSGYGDDVKGFYAVYQSAFQKIYEGELESTESLKGRLDDLSKAGLGNSTSTWEDVAYFYQVWESFSTSLSFAWADPWETSQAEHRRMKRAMEDENKKARKVARKTYNDEILALVRFVKRRDPRVKERQAQMQQEKIAKQRQQKEETAARKKEKKEAMEVWRAQAEEEMATKEEEDRVAGRIRLADLEDDYDYGGKKGKKGKKSKKKNKTVESSSDDEVRDADKRMNGETDEGIVDAENDAAASETSDGVKQQSVPDESDVKELSSSSSESEEPDAWRCECCKKDFKSLGQMNNHLQSKKHKAAWKKYEKKMQQQALEEMMDELSVGKDEE